MTDHIPANVETKFNREVKIDDDDLLRKDEPAFRAWLDTMKKGIVYLARRFLHRQKEALRNLKGNRRYNSERSMASRKKRLQEWVTKWQAIAAKRHGSRLLRRSNFDFIAGQLRGGEWYLVSGATFHFSLAE